MDDDRDCSNIFAKCTGYLHSHTNICFLKKSPTSIQISWYSLEEDFVFLYHGVSGARQSEWKASARGGIPSLTQVPLSCLESPRVHLLQTAKEVKLMFLFSGSLAWPQALFPILLSPRLSPCTSVAPLNRHRCQGVDWTDLQNAFTTKKQLPPPLGIGTMQTDTETPLKAHLRFGTRSGPRDVLFYILPRVLYLPLQSML